MNYTWQGVQLPEALIDFDASESTMTGVLPPTALKRVSIDNSEIHQSPELMISFQTVERFQLWDMESFEHSVSIPM